MFEMAEIKVEKFEIMDVITSSSCPNDLGCGEYCLLDD